MQTMQLANLQTMQLDAVMHVLVSAEYAYSNLNAWQQPRLMFYIIIPSNVFRKC